MKRPIYHNHTDDDNACFSIAFYMVKDLKNGEILSADAFELLDGSKPINGEKIICGNCRNVIYRLDENNLIPPNHSTHEDLDISNLINKFQVILEIANDRVFL